MFCTKCGTEFEGNFCPKCGQSVGQAEASQSINNHGFDDKGDIVVTKQAKLSLTFAIVFAVLAVVALVIGIVCMFIESEIALPVLIVFVLIGIFSFALFNQYKNKRRRKSADAQCPVCGSKSLATHKEYPVGIAVAGIIDSHRVVVTCLNCGHRWKM